MNEEYLNAIVDAAEQKITKSGMPITDGQLIPGLVTFFI